MSRKLLTEVLPVLIPVRIKQKILFKNIADMIKSYKYSKNKSETELPVRIYKYKSLLLRKLGDTDMQLQHNKVINLKLAAKNINGTLIKPGETFSFFKLVGDPNAKKGYKEGVTLMNGGVVAGVGGGICQLGNLLHWIVIHSELDVVERHRHTFDPFPDYGRVIPFGTGATLHYNLLDIKIQNNTNLTYQINVWFDDEYIHGELKCMQVPETKIHIVEKNHHFYKKNNEYFRHNEIYQKVVNRKTGLTISENHLFTNDSLVKYKLSSDIEIKSNNN